MIEELFVPTNFNIGTIFEELSSVGATSVRLLTEDFRLALLEEAEGYVYQPEDEIVGSGDRVVRQQVSSFDGFPEGSGYVLLKNFFQDLLEQRLARLETYPFETVLDFDTMVLQRYEKGSLGITPHKDGLSFINLVCVFVIGGRGRFYVCSDRAGREARKWCEPHFPDSAHSQLPAFRACSASNSTGGRYPRLECNRFWL